jgi:hypothetical protein
VNKQIRLFLKTLTGEVVLPSEDEMNKDTEDERRQKAAMGIAERYESNVMAAAYKNHFG